MGKNYIGIDIGEFSINFVEVKKKRNKEQVEKFEIVNIPVNTSSKEDYIINKINEVVKKNRWTRNHINISCYSKDITARGFKIPVMPEEEIEPVVKREVRRLYGDTPDKKTIYQIVGKTTEEEKELYSIFFVIVPNEIVRSFEKLDFKINSLDFTVFSIDRILKRYLKEGENTLFIDFGYENTKLFMYSGKSLEIYREINIGGREITQTISDVLQTNFDAAEELKYGYGLVTKSEAEKLNQFGEKKANQLNFAYQLVMNKLIRKISYSMDYFNTQHRGHTISDIHIFGGGAKLKNLQDFLEEEYPEKKVSLFSAMDSFSFKKGVLDLFSESSLSFPDALGASLLEDKILKINKKEEVKFKITSKQINAFAAVLIIVPIIGLYSYYKYIENEQKKEIVSLENKIKSFEPIETEFNEIQEGISSLKLELEELNGLIKEKGKFKNLLIDLSYLTGENIYFKDINFNENKISLKGNGISKDSFPEIYINNFVSRLESKYKNIKLNQTKKVSINSENYGAEFEIDIFFEREVTEKNDNQ